MKKTEITVVVVSYNTKDLLHGCLESIYKHENEAKLQVIVVDNASKDGSPEMVIQKFPKAKLVKSSENLGFAKGNNLAKKYATGKYVLLFNSDALLHKNTLVKTLSKIESDGKIGALGCKILLPSGELDKDARRSFPTPWVSLTHFSGLGRLLPKSRIFAKYWYTYMSEDVEHEVDVLQGAFMLCRKDVLDDVGWFDEDYFLDGEDIDLCWKIKQKGYKLIYYPKATITHVKKASKKTPTKEERKKIIESGVRSMELFYRKRLWDKYPFWVNFGVKFSINLLKIIRSVKIRLF